MGNGCDMSFHSFFSRAQEFDHLLQTKTFSERVVALGTGRDAFCYRLGVMQGFVNRSVELVSFMHVSLDLLYDLHRGYCNHQVSPLISTLGLKPGYFYFNRRSNLPSVPLIYDLSFAFFGMAMQYLLVKLSSMVTQYFWHFIYWHISGSVRRLRLITLFATYYNHTRELFVDDPKLWVLIATDSLKVGNIAVCIEQHSPVNTSISGTDRLERRV